MATFACWDRNEEYKDGRKTGSQMSCLPRQEFLLRAKCARSAVLITPMRAALHLRARPEVQAQNAPGLSFLSHRMDVRHYDAKTLDIDWLQL
jgi:hypothetical protein